MGFKVYLVISPAHLLQIEIKTIWLSIQFEVSKLCYLPRDETLTPLTPPPPPNKRKKGNCGNRPRHKPRNFLRLGFSQNINDRGAIHVIGEARLSVIPSWYRLAAKTTTLILVIKTIRHRKTRTVNRIPSGKTCPPTWLTRQTHPLTKVLCCSPSRRKVTRGRTSPRQPQAWSVQRPRLWLLFGRGKNNIGFMLCVNFLFLSKDLTQVSK